MTAEPSDEPSSDQVTSKGWLADDWRADEVCADDNRPAEGYPRDGLPGDEAPVVSHCFVIIVHCSKSREMNNVIISNRPSICQVGIVNIEI